MKKILLLNLMFLTFQSAVTAQKKNPALNTPSKDTAIVPIKDGAYYLALSKTKRSAGFVKLSVGTALIGAGLLLGNSKESSFGDAGTGLVIGIVGLILDISSLASFSKAHSYKQQAKLMMTSQSSGKNMLSPKYNGGVYAGTITGLSLFVPIGKSN